MPRDIDVIIERIQATYPTVRVEQLKVAHPTDDDGLWFFTRLNFAFEVQLESSNSQCPFSIETDEHGERVKVNTPEDAIATLKACLRLGSPNRAQFEAVLAKVRDVEPEEHDKL